MLVDRRAHPLPGAAGCEDCRPLSVCWASCSRSSQKETSPTRLPTRSVAAVGPTCDAQHFRPSLFLRACEWLVLRHHWNPVLSWQSGTCRRTPSHWKGGTPVRESVRCLPMVKMIVVPFALHAHSSRPAQSCPTTMKISFRRCVSTGPG